MDKLHDHLRRARLAWAESNVEETDFDLEQTISEATTIINITKEIQTARAERKQLPADPD